MGVIGSTGPLKIGGSEGLGDPSRGGTMDD